MEPFHVSEDIWGGFFTHFFHLFYIFKIEAAHRDRLYCKNEEMERI